jgi:hypothetical protein
MIESKVHNCDYELRKIRENNLGKDRVVFVSSEKVSLFSKITDREFSKLGILERVSYG